MIHGPRAYVLAMVELNVRDGELDVQVQGLHQIWALRRRMSVPLSAVTRVRRAPRDVLRNVWKGWRAPGTHVPGVLVAGTFYKDGERHFWDVRRAERAIEIDLSGVEFDRMFVEVDDPERAITEIELARTNRLPR